MERILLPSTLCSCLLCRNKKIDSAFSILERISFNQWFDDYEALLTESRFEKLKKDKRWLPVLEKIKKN